MARTRNESGLGNFKFLTVGVIYAEGLQSPKGMWWLEEHT